MCDLLKGNYSDVVDHFTIIDCRFPYEYKGGHIKGAKNIWKEDECLNLFFDGSLQHPQEGHREIFVFHCEFSSKRGPKMYVSMGERVSLWCTCIVSLVCVYGERVSLVCVL